jgi:hypothetical protein
MFLIRKQRTPFVAVAQKDGVNRGVGWFYVFTQAHTAENAWRGVDWTWGLYYADHVAVLDMGDDRRHLADSMRLDTVQRQQVLDLVPGTRAANAVPAQTAGCKPFRT